MEELLEDIDKLLECSNKVLSKADGLPESDILNSIGLSSIRLNRYASRLKSAIESGKCVN